MRDIVCNASQIHKGAQSLFFVKEHLHVYLILGKNAWINFMTLRMSELFFLVNSSVLFSCLWMFFFDFIQSIIYLIFVTFYLISTGKLCFSRENNGNTRKAISRYSIRSMTLGSKGLGFISSALKSLRKFTCFHFFIYTMLGKER